MYNLIELVNCTQNNHPLNIKDGVLQSIEKDYQLMLNVVKSDSTTYGFNTLVGHKDNVKLKNNDYLNQLLKSHLIGFGEKFTQKECQFIINAKLCSWMAGGTGVSLSTFNKLYKNSVDTGFKPSIPKKCSYSSGDVIPATHLLNDFLHYNNYHDFNNTDIMPFINGNFVQVGYAASLIATINKYWHLFTYSSLISSRCFEANHSNYCLNFSRDDGRENPLVQRVLSLFRQVNVENKPVQDIITIRSLPQQLHNFIKNAHSYFEVLDECLSKPSGNPLFNRELEDSISQASFLAFNITDSALLMINSVKLLMVAAINRTKFLLSGKLADIPADCSLDDNDLGLIQIPKLMMAIEERVSLNVPPASVYAAKSTSNGVEDLWNNGLICINLLAQILEEAMSVLKIELYVHSYIFSNIDSIAAKIHKLHSILNLDASLFANKSLDADNRTHLETFLDLVDSEYNTIKYNEFFRVNALLPY